MDNAFSDIKMLFLLNMNKGDMSNTIDSFSMEHVVSIIYSMIQSDWNSFFGDVVLDCLDTVFKDIDSILGKTYKKQVS